MLHKLPRQLWSMIYTFFPLGMNEMAIVVILDGYTRNLSNRIDALSAFWRKNSIRFTLAFCTMRWPWQLFCAPHTKSYGFLSTNSINRSLNMDFWFGHLPRT